MVRLALGCVLLLLRDCTIILWRRLPDCEKPSACYNALRKQRMATATVLIDKFALVQSLEKRGFTRTQAEAIADSVTDIAPSRSG